MQSKDYLMVLPVRFYRVSGTEFAGESAFMLHLRQLSGLTRQWGEDLTVFAPMMDHEEYDRSKGYLSIIDSHDANIHYVDAYPSSRGRLLYALTWPFLVLPKLVQAVRSASVVHAGPSCDTLRPFEILAIFIAVLLRKKTVFVVDIDERESARMAYATGTLSRRSYWIRKCVHDPFMHLQMRFAARYCSLLLLKGQSLVDDYGRNREKVKNFYDTAHDSRFVISDQTVNTRYARLENSRTEIRLVYFGRFVEYKGIKEMIAVVKQLQDQSDGHGFAISLTLIGTGEQSPELLQVISESGLEQAVHMLDPIEYGEPLFEELQNYDFLLATPLAQDTPRNVFDAMSVGLPILAYGTYYYRDLEVNSGAVKTVPWRDRDALGDLILEVAADVPLRMEMIANGVKFARENTQMHWLEKRHQWQLEFLGVGAESSVRLKSR